MMAIKNKIRVLILGGSGMLGSAVFKRLSKEPQLEVYASARNSVAKKAFNPSLAKRIITGIDVENTDSLVTALSALRPAVVINCIGIVKQLEDSHDTLKSIPINALLPHRLANLCSAIGSRLILMSTDCVFSGNKGNYKESDFPDGDDLYGRSKLLGEIANASHVLTLRTSIIGHEINSSNGLLEWFLAQDSEVKGFKNAIFSGLPTTELANVICKIILREKTLSGLFHISTNPISKYDLLSLIAQVYRKKVVIRPVLQPRINRSLNCTQFSKKTGYKTKPWLKLIEEMRAEYLGSSPKK
jgi:dTDP-4-dehydrorhamnose reductase